MRFINPLLALALFMTTGSLFSTAGAQSRMRVNRMAELLGEGKAVFGAFMGDKTPVGGAAIVENSEIDFVFYDMERGPFDVPLMQIYMQFMLDRASLLKSNTLTNHHPVVTRIPPIRDDREEARRRVQAVLDAGAHGIVFPHVESAADAELAVQSMRYAGTRPSGSGQAPRYWGVSEEDYRRRAELWPLSPDGDLINLILIEDQVGVENAREIVSTEGVSVVIPGPGDLRRAYNNDGPAIENAIQTVLAACKEFDVPCGITAGPDDIEKRLNEGFKVIITSGEALAIGRRAAGR